MKNEIRLTPLGKHLVELRVKLGKDTVQLAKEIGTAPANISRWENQKRKIRRENREKIARAYGTTVEEIERLIELGKEGVTVKLEGANFIHLIKSIAGSPIETLTRSDLLFLMGIQSELPTALPPETIVSLLRCRKS